MVYYGDVIFQNIVAAKCQVHKFFPTCVNIHKYQNVYINNTLSDLLRNVNNL